MKSCLAHHSSPITHHSAFSLIEIIVALAVFMIISSTLTIMVLGTLSATQSSFRRLQAQAFVQEGHEAVQSIRDFDWNLLAAGTHGLSDANGYWEFAGGSDTPIAELVRSVTVSDLSAYEKEITVRVTWSPYPGVTDEVRSVSRIAQTSAISWIQSVSADFSAGSFENTQVVSVGDGGVELKNLGDWSAGTVIATQNFSGDGNVERIAIVGNTLYLAAKNDGSEEEFFAFSIADVAQGTLTEIGSTELGTSANDLAISGGFVFLATEDNNQEVKIVNLSSFQLVNGINVPGSGKAHAVAISGNTLYVGTSRNSSQKEFFAYDITNPLASPLPLLGSVEIDHQVNDISLQGDYAYLATDHDSRELTVVRLSSSELINSVNFSGSTNMETVVAAGNDLYVGRNGSSNPELHKLDISDPEGSITTTSSVQFDSYGVSDLARYEGKLYASLDGHPDEIAIIDTSSFAIETQINAGEFETKSIFVHDIYIFIGNDDNQHTLQVIQGGSGSNQSYGTAGTFISSAYDTGGSATSYGAFSWVSSGSGTLTFQIRTAATEAELASASWVGPDGTASSQYASSNTQIQTAPGAGKRWIQYRAVMSGNGSTTPTLEQVVISY